MIFFEEEQNRLFSDFADPDVIKKAFNDLQKEKESERVGHYTLPEESIRLVKEINDFEAQNPFLKNNSVKNIVVLGVGGSSLGIKAVDSMLKHTIKSGKTLFFMENSDPIEISKTFSKIQKEDSLFVIISKSGTTIETISMFKTTIAHFTLDLDREEDRQRLIVVTDHDSSLSKFSKDHGIKEFNVPSNVGGRFSILSAVGIVPLKLVGHDVENLLLGAKKMIESFFEGDEGHIAQKAFYYYKNADKYPINVVFSYSSRLENLNKWYVQLWGESLGKMDDDGERKGLTPVALIGAVDQHSFLQLIIQGPRDKTVTFIKVEDFENDLKIPNITLKYIEKTDFVNGNTYEELIDAQCEATMKSLVQTDIPCDKITLKKINASNTGRLIAYFELLTSLIGAMLKINTYDQPGVELGKNILKEEIKRKR